jgi:hypothetical protein
VVAVTIQDAPRVQQEDLPPRNKTDDQPTYVEELRPLRSMREDDAFEAQQKVAHVNEMAPKIGLTSDDVEVMFAVTWDERASWEELATERGETSGALRHRIQRLQEKIRKGWSRRIAPRLLFTLLLLAMLALSALGALGLARKPPLPVPLPGPVVHEGVVPSAPAAVGSPSQGKAHVHQRRAGRETAHPHGTATAQQGLHPRCTGDRPGRLAAPPSPGHAAAARDMAAGLELAAADAAVSASAGAVGCGTLKLSRRGALHT